VRLEKDAREYREHGEEVRLRELEITRRKKAKARADGNERTRQYRDRIRAAKIADGYVPGTKRVSVSRRVIFRSLTLDKSCLAWLKPSVFWREVFLNCLTGLNQVQPVLQ
jgi:hypothetical protein